MSRKSINIDKHMVNDIITIPFYIFMPLFKRLIIGFLIFLILTNSVSAKVYPDVPVNYKHHEAIAYMSNQGTVKGYQNGEFHPDGLINRAEAVKIMTKSLYPSSVINNALKWHKKSNHSYVIFPDVPIWEWFGKYVEISFQNNIIQGYPDGTFKPANNINFAEALKVILETYKTDFSKNNYNPNKLLIVPQGEWYEKYFTYAYKYNLINQNKIYHPGQLITRGEFVEVIYRLDTVLKNGLKAYTNTTPNTSNEYKITIPKLGIIDIDVNFANVYDPNSALKILQYGLGHYLNPPNLQKKLVLFGHSSGYSWDKSHYKTILREINKLNNGDRIYINYKEKGYVYEVYNSNIIPSSQDYTLVQNENINELTLYTCWPPNSITQRYVVYGKPV